MTHRIRRNKKKKTKGGTRYSPKARDIKLQGISLPLGQIFQSALQNFQSGNLSLAEQLCQQLLNEDPGNADANHFLGVITAQQGGEINKVIEYIEKAIELSNNPDRIALLRHTLRNDMKNSTLMDHQAFTRKIESAYTKLWSEYCK